MVKIFGRSDSELAFLEALNNGMSEVRLESLDDYQDFEKYPEKRIIETSSIFKKQILEKENIKKSLSNRNQHIFFELKRINTQIQYKRNVLPKVYGYLKNKIRAELNGLWKEKEEFESELRTNKESLNDLTTQIDQLKNNSEYIKKNIKEDYENMNELNKTSDFIYLRQGAFGENKVIDHIKKVFGDYKNFYLINGFDLDLKGEALNVHNHTLQETKIDHVLLCPQGVFILETKAWRSFYDSAINKIEKQTERIDSTLKKKFSKDLELKDISRLVVCTEKYIPLSNSKDWHSIMLGDLKKEVLSKKEKLSKGDINLLLGLFKDHFNTQHAGAIDKTSIMLKSNFVKATRFIRSKIKRSD